MCSRTAARSVAAMRPYLFRLTAAAGATAAVLAVPSTAHSADAVYGGSAPGGDPIVVKADPDAKQLRSIAVSWRADCSNGDWYPGGGVLTPAKPVPGFVASPNELLVSRNAKGRFKGTQLTGATNAAITVDVSGKLMPGRATGTLTATVKVIDPATGNAVTSCQKTQTWTATRVPGSIYGGATSQGQPFVVRMNPKARLVNDVITTWYAKCTPEGVFRAPDHFVDFSISKTGAFGNPFDFDVDMKERGKRHYDYVFTGRLKRSRASGLLRVKVAETDAAGAPGASCDSGGLTWKATTG